MYSQSESILPLRVISTKVCSILECVKCWFSFIAGTILFLFAGKQSEKTYNSMRKLYFLSNGAIARWALRLSRVFSKPYKTIKESRFKNLEKELNKAAILIKKEGLYSFQNSLSSEVVGYLKCFALTTPCKPLIESGNEYFSPPVLFDPNSVKATGYYFDRSDLLRSKEIQEFISDSLFLKLAQQYFRSKPILLDVGMWWSTAYSGTPSSRAAQLYHADLDVLNSLVFFVYLTDVSSENGPFSYVRGSATHFIPESVRRDGRIQDEEILNAYGPEAIVEVTGPMGTVFVANNMGFHKGKMLNQGHRLIFTLVFTNSLLGKPRTEGKEVIEKTSGMIEALEKFPVSYKPLWV